MDDNSWTPPSEAEMKIIKARRERSDKISKIIADYLLKGYKMLNENCRICPDSTVLLQNTQSGEKFCVSCNEFDTDATKDDPVLSQAAAMSVIREEQARIVTPRASRASNVDLDEQSALLVTRSAVLTKLSDATRLLDECHLPNDLDCATLYLSFIDKCSTLLISLK